MQKYVELPQELYLDIPFEISPEMHFEILFETSPELYLEIYLCNSIMHANSHPQPPYQASAWSCGYASSVRAPETVRSIFFSDPGRPPETPKPHH